MKSKSLKFTLIALTLFCSQGAVAQIDSRLTNRVPVSNTKTYGGDDIAKLDLHDKAHDLSKMKLNPQILKSLLKANSAKSKMGGVNGGGGTSVHTNRSKTIVLWDLYANNPLYSEDGAGDQIVSPLNAEITRVHYAGFKSFRILKEKLSPLENQFPNLYKMITEDQFIDGDSTLALFSTLQYVKNPEELFRKYDYWPEGDTISPLAHFDEKTSFIYLNQDLWNQMGLESQAGFILHERLRQIQLHHRELSNELIQGIVSFVIDTDLAMIMEFKPNDQFFNFKPAQNLKPIEQVDPLIRFLELKNLGFFSETKTEVRNPNTVGERNFKPTLATSILLSDTKNCTNLVSGFESVTNTFRDKINCSDRGPEAGSLGGTGELYFKSPIVSKKIIIEVVASLYNPNDGGSEIEFNIFKDSDKSSGVRTQIANYGQPHISTNLNSATYPSLESFHFTWQSMKTYNTYRIVMDRETHMFAVYMIAENQTVLLASASISDEINLSTGNLFWSFAINNNSVVKKIQINQ